MRSLQGILNFSKKPQWRNPPPSPFSMATNYFIPTKDNLYDDEDFSVILEHYLTKKPQANLPRHCMNLDLVDEPVRGPMSRRPLGVREVKKRCIDTGIEYSQWGIRTCLQLVSSNG